MTTNDCYTLTPLQKESLDLFKEEYGEECVVLRAPTYKHYAFELPPEQECDRILVVYHSPFIKHSFFCRAVWQKKDGWVHQYHRTDGPAVIVYKEPGIVNHLQWFINGDIKTFDDVLSNIAPDERKEFLLRYLL